MKIANTNSIDFDYRIKLAIVTSGISKAFTFVSQLLAIPLVITALGVEKFGIFTMITSVLAWVSLASIGLFPGLTREITKNSDKTSNVDTELFSSVFAIILFIVIPVGLLISLIVVFSSVEFIFGKKYTSYEDEIKYSMLLALWIIVFQVIFSTADAVRAGLHQQHVTNIWGALGNLLSIALLLIGAFFIPTISFVILAMYGSITIAKLFNLGHLLLDKSNNISLGIAFFNKSFAKVLFYTGTAFLISQIAVMINQQLIVYVVGYIVGPNDVASFSIMIRLTIIFGGVVIMITQPTWPAISQSLKNNNYAWARKRALKTMIVIMSYAILFALTLHFYGGLIISYWLGDKVIISQGLITLTSLYFIVVIWNHYCYVILIAVGQTWIPAIVLLSEAVVALLVSLYLIPKLGIEGGMLSLLIAGVLVTAIIAPIRIKKSNLFSHL